ncbi:hypothetical protein OKW22_000788 [Bacilli bacterium PM5-3]|nr:hypothetical protein [Bacilli bacterium PM5-3]MDH6603624.1 hypothetical protein [Bacilli bacterium PM5-9]
MKEVTIYLTNAEEISIIRLKNNSKINNVEIGNLSENNLLSFLENNFFTCHNDNENAIERNYIVNTNSIAKITYK